MLKSKVKQDGIVYTPEWVVKLMTEILFSNQFYNVSICDPACGAGAFLNQIVDVVCANAKATPKRFDDCMATLDQLTGFDIDHPALELCRRTLTSTFLKHFPSHTSPKWNLHNIDGIEEQQWKKYEGRFDFVIGNPPYVRIQHLEQHRRDKISEGQWQLVGGCTDLYMIFYEYGIRLLKENGSMSYITPSSWMKSLSGRGFRNFLRKLHVNSIYDFGDYQVFPGVTTYTAIMTMTNKQQANQMVPAHKYLNGGFKDGYVVNTTEKIWYASESKGTELSSDFVPLKRVSNIRVGIQTLLDSVFIVPIIEESENHGNEYFKFKSLNGGSWRLIEKEITKKIVKASVMKNGRDPEHRILIYPYSEGGELLEEEYIETEYPYAYAWLRENKRKLELRDKGRATKYRWYEYGRSVGIKTGFGQKILTSGMNLRPNFQLCSDEDTLFYSGYAIQPLPYVSFGALLRQLNSDRMLTFIQERSKPFRNGWFSYAKTYIQEFPIKISEVINDA